MKKKSPLTPEQVTQLTMRGKRHLKRLEAVMSGVTKKYQDAMKASLKPVQDCPELRKTGYTPIENFDNKDADVRKTLWTGPVGLVLSTNGDPEYRETDRELFDKELARLRS